MPNDDTTEKEPRDPAAAAHQYPLRVRLPGGRVTHAARRLDDGIGYITACALYISDREDKDWKPSGTPVHIRCAIKLAAREEA
ncbi:hypothetical protein [Streptomyces scabiei]|uniref:hypothetical protein n=1 Tax=Streptomyces scabiei TaxID=1930 RepID=UPI001B31D548|nr:MULTISPECIES: hypothetical protein [unclassified Streptomyces]MBP5896398.1 hypothetical protein [Streptomyces sp. LBUM 1481]MBP5926774.1 hypothetical protein [Streptomyces sp. LBUM 1483]